MSSNLKIHVSETKVELDFFLATGPVIYGKYDLESTKQRFLARILDLSTIIQRDIWGTEGHVPHRGSGSVKDTMLTVEMWMVVPASVPQEWFGCVLSSLNPLIPFLILIIPLPFDYKR